MTLTDETRPLAAGAVAPTTEPLVTVVICVYNAGRYLRPSIKSVLAQTHRNLEILIIDDGSTDGCIDTIADLTDPRIRLLRQENSGKPAALNRALRELRGEFFAIHDADDLSHPTRIAEQLAALQADPSLAAVFAGFELLLDDRRVAPTFTPRSPEQCRADIDALRMPAHDATAMFRTKLVRNLRYEESLALGEGRDFILQVGERHPLAVVGACLYSYRVHDDSITVREDGRRDHYDLEVARRAFERRGRPAPAPDAIPRSRSKRHMLVAHWMDSVANLREARRWGEAWRTAWACVWFGGGRPYFWRPLAYAVAPLWLLRRYRRRRMGGGES